MIFYSALYDKIENGENIWIIWIKDIFRHNGNVFIYLFIYSNIFIQGVYIFAKMLF